MTNVPPPLLLSRRQLLLLGAGAALSVGYSAPVLAAPPQKAHVAIPEKKPKAPRLIMIDPGHGGHDPGAIGVSGTLEKDVTLDIARKMQAALSRQPGIIAKLTRDRDEFLPLPERVLRAREAKADLFISVHADSAPTRSARGLSAYSLSDKGTDDFARELARRENSVDEIGGVPLKDTDADVAAILMDLTARHTRNAALKAKRRIVKGAGRDWLLLENPMRAANFAVLRAPDVPSLLIETGFLSSPKDEALLSNNRQRQKIAGILARELGGILQSPPFA